MRSTKFFSNTAHNLKRKTVRRRAIRASLLISNVIILALVGTFFLNGSKINGQSAPVIDSSNPASGNPLDQVSSADIALTVAQLNNLPESNAVANQAQSAAADVAMSTTNDNVIAKPEVVATSLKSKADIQDYVSVSGDDVASLAAKFGITSDSIMWSNGLTSNNLNPGTKLVIPPVNGIVYTVKPGDTPDTLASRYQANSAKIVAYNDAEINGLVVSQQIIIPDAVLASSKSSALSTSSSSSSTSFPWGNGPIYGSNGYDFGYCTWYVASQIPVPSNWGNASSWAFYARASGWNVSQAPAVGAIAQKGGGEGHVAIVIGVNPDGSVLIKDMNGFAGWGRVGTGTVSAGFFQNYITP